MVIASRAWYAIERGREPSTDRQVNTRKSTLVDRLSGCRKADAANFKHQWGQRILNISGANFEREIWEAGQHNLLECGDGGRAPWRAKWKEEKKKADWLIIQATVEKEKETLRDIHKGAEVQPTANAQ